MKFLLAFLMGFFYQALAFAQSASPSPAGFVEPSVNPGSVMAEVLKDLIFGKKVAAAAGAVLIGVWIFRQYFLPKLNLGSGILPYVSLALGALIGILSAIFGGASPQEAASIFLLSGPTASTLWSSVFKLLSKKDDAV